MYTYLDGVWNLYYAEQGTSKVERPSDLPESGIPHVKATVPGNVELDLSKAGVLPEDLFYGLNILEAEKYETYEWWYTTTFNADKLDNLMLHFEAVDCFADYYVNDTLVFQSDNMFIPHEFDISKVAKVGENTLCVHIRSALIEATNTPTELYEMAATPWRKEIPSVHARKAPHSYGWDIMPRAISAGIWRSVYVYNKPEIDFEQLYIFTRNNVNDLGVRLGMAYELSLPNNLVRKPIEFVIDGVCGDSTFTFTDTVFFKSGCLWYHLENPKLWWPKGYGDPSLYDVKVTAKIDGETIAEKTVKLGIRTLKLEYSDTTDGVNGYFRFIVNGKEIMAKGSNWVPMDAYHSRDAQRYEKALKLVNDVGCNMLRCWGGNVYEDHAFYDFCDENGIMVWQDFSMACHAYPRSEKFLNQLGQEAESIIKRLRQHVCIALWSGDNECDSAVHSSVNPNQTQTATRKVLKDAVFTHDFVRPYLPSSPFYSDELMRLPVRENVMPEDHLWGPRDYFKSDFYKNAKAHFVSETGYHGCPTPESVRKIVTPDCVWPPCNKEWYFHSTTQDYSDGRVNLMINQIRQLFGIELPETLEEFSLLSQLSQAEAKKFFIERIRNNRPITSGVLWWNLIDGWPQMSDAVVDYFYDKKIAYHYIKVSQNPFLICCKENVNSFLPLVACNDTLETQKGVVKVTDGDTGEVLYSGEFSVAENGCETLCRIPMDYSAKRLLLIEWTANGKVGKNHYISGLVPFDKEKFKKWYEIIKERVI